MKTLLKSLTLIGVFALAQPAHAQPTADGELGRARALVAGLPSHEAELVRAVESATADLIEPLLKDLLQSSSRFEVAALVDLLASERDMTDQHRLLGRLTDERGTHVKLISQLLDLYEKDPRRFDRLKSAVARLDREAKYLRPSRPPVGNRLTMGLLYSASLLTYTYGYFGTWADAGSPASIAYWAGRAKTVAWAALFYVGLQVGGEIIALRKAWPSYVAALKTHRHAQDMLEHLKTWIREVETDPELRALRETLRYAASDRPARDLQRLLPELAAEAERRTAELLESPDRMRELRAFTAQTRVVTLIREFEATLSETEKEALRQAYEKPGVKYELPWTLIPKMQALERELFEKFEASLSASDRGDGVGAGREQLTILTRVQGEGREQRAGSAHMVGEAVIGNFTLTVSLAIAAVSVGVGNSALPIDGHILQPMIEWVRTHPQTLLWAAALGTAPSFYAPVHRLIRRLHSTWKKGASPAPEAPEFEATDAEYEILRRYLIGRRRSIIPLSLNPSHFRARLRCHGMHGP